MSKFGICVSNHDFPKTKDKSAWRTDEEFAREMLAGLNTVVIRLLEEFPPNNKLNPKVYKDEASSKTKECIEKNLEGLTLEELSLPHPDGDQLGEVSEVYTLAEHGDEGTVWQLAKANVNESGYHQLICHWLHTHAVIEPFMIATNRQLSVLHPIHKLLHPHFRDTMNINALAKRTVFPANCAMEWSAVA
ncbi:hypothetical protein RHGRI_034142 [Rhododendron griersonianum]|uniref:Lipoxygenase domain-containing protein n=1 Tax=Rhododendron griersonianum TaxID=479676 RepID=A0AAV6I216_9ERIC|nr:hypothetical protein RHGRI_034142 [Rhododendron griersonianum]